MSTTLGTSHFVSIHAAIRYYQDYGYTLYAVMQKIERGEISIGKPECNEHQRLTVLDNGTRYGITEEEWN